MKTINWKRILLGGIAAGVVQFLIEGVANGAVLNGDWMMWKSAMTGNALWHAPGESMSLTLWFIESLLLGWVGLWIYAGLRTRFGAGPKTALQTALFLWFAAWVSCAINQIALGDIPVWITLVNCAFGLVAAALSMLAGAWMYQEA